jgi:hypothetical protein
MSGHHPATVRLAGRKRHARFESSEALAELPAVACTAVELHGCCARVSLAAALLSQHIDGVARAGSAGTKSGSRTRSLVLLTMLAPVVENRTVRGSATIGLDDEANSQIRPTEVPRAAAFRVAPPSAICQLPASARSS